MLMKRIWPWIYLGLFLIALLGETRVLWNRRAWNASPHWDSVIGAAAMGLLFPPLAVWFAKFRGKSHLIAPSFFRGFAGGWWTDPLQCLHLAALLSVGSFVGSLLTMSRASAQNDAVMHVYWNGALAIGFVIGNIIARYVFRKDIN